MIQAARTDASFLADQAAQHWSNVLIRCSTACPTNIDALLAPSNALAQAAAGAVVFADTETLAVARTLGEADRPAIGVMLDDQSDRLPTAEVAALAARYAALAVEKDCDIVILSSQHTSGFERFGFRVERIAGKTAAERAACLDQIKRFWGIDVVI